MLHRIVLIQKAHPCVSPRGLSHIVRSCNVWFDLGTNPSKRQNHAGKSEIGVLRIFVGHPFSTDFDETWYVCENTDIMDILLRCLMVKTYREGQSSPIFIKSCSGPNNIAFR
jgi:hypothetical protein